MFSGVVDDVDEVTDEAVVERSVVEVAGNAGGEKSYGGLSESFFDVPEEEKCDDGEESDDGDSDEHVSFSAGDAECGARV